MGRGAGSRPRAGRPRAEALRPHMEVAPEVEAAVEAGEPVVALESTLIAHGMPYPHNLHTALAVEGIVRERGAVPATVAIVSGRIKVGLDEADLRLIASAPDVYKASTLDIPVLCSKGWHGATTVSATMAIAERAGIRVCGTGGIGGVHRNAPETFDISPDLTELGRTSVAVVCAGAKSILDLAWTLEYLETLGVPVLGYQTEDFPAFFCRTSGYPVDYRVDSPEEVARIMACKWALGLEGGIVVARPVSEAYALDPVRMDRVIEEALEDAEERGIRGKGVTPFLLASIQTRTGGKSLEANIALVRENTALAADIAVAWSRLKAEARAAP